MFIGRNFSVGKFPHPPVVADAPVDIASRRHAERNRLTVMFSHLAGLRVGEIAGLIFDDVLETDGSVTDRIHINPAIAKGGVGRTVFVNKRLQREIRRYLEALS